MNDILYKIDNMTELYDLDRIIRKCENRKKTIAEDTWEKLYKDRCKEHYIPLRQVFADIWLFGDANKARELEAYYYDHSHGLSSLLTYAKILELEIPYNVGKMACTACMCGGCPYQAECCGYTCETCKPHYTGYQWTCEE